jgi:predicted MFS family arabinose efflux permease
VAALLVVNMLPALVNLIAIGLKWDDRDLGLLASADVAGITLGSLVGVPIVRRVALRTVVIIGVVALFAADIGCAVGNARWVIVSYRFAGGMASGLILAACYAIYSESNPQRNFATFSIAQMVSGFIGVTVLPILALKFGWRSSFVAIACVTALAVPLGVLLPAHSYTKTLAPHQTNTSRHTGLALWISLAGIVLYVIGEGAVWTFMERIGAASGVSERDVNTAVSACTLVGVFGAVVTMFPSKRLGLVVPLTASALLSVAAVGFIRSPNPGVFIASLCAFNFAWLAFSTLQFGVIAKADSVGTATVAMSAAWYAGFTIGPYLAGDLVIRFGFVSVQYLGIGGVLIAFVSLLPLIIVRRISVTPAPATRTDTV